MLPLIAQSGEGGVCLPCALLLPPGSAAIADRPTGAKPFVCNPTECFLLSILLPKGLFVAYMAKQGWTAPAKPMGTSQVTAGKSRDFEGLTALSPSKHASLLPQDIPSKF